MSQNTRADLVALAYGELTGESLSPLLVDGAPDESGMLLCHQELIVFTGPPSGRSGAGTG